MANWIIACAILLDPIIQQLKNHLLAQPMIHTDESPKLNSEGSIKNIVLYDYQPTRAGHCGVDYLQDYDQYLMVDGYAAYGQTKAALVGCMAHARRKFIEAQRAQVKGKTGKADWAANQIQKLYRAELQLTPPPTNAIAFVRKNPNYCSSSLKIG